MVIILAVAGIISYKGILAAVEEGFLSDTWFLESNEMIVGLGV